MLSLYCLGLALVPSFAAAFSFNFTNTPAQCQNLSISIDGAGQPPYSVVIIPFGASPLPNNIEARRIFQQQFNGSSTTASFQLKYPSNSQFVAVVSDSSGFGTGGTSGAVTVLSTDDASCFNATQEVQPDFAFSIVPGGELIECSPTRIWWDPAVVQGSPTFHGIIPGGNSFTIPQGPLSNVSSEGLGFNWTVSVRTGTTVMLMGGDDRGIGSAGSGMYIIGQGTTDSCLNSQSPSSTPGSPAGGAYPTSTGAADTDHGSSGSGTDTGAIVGGVVGGVVGLACLLVLLYLCRRRGQGRSSTKERPVDLLQDHSDHDHDEVEGDAGLPEYYQPEPYLVPDPTVASSVGAAEEEGLQPTWDRRQSRISATSASSSNAYLRAGTPDYHSASGSTSYRKSPAPPVFRPVNIIQHDDAGPPPPDAGETETIELPPAYNKIRDTPATMPDEDAPPADDTPAVDPPAAVPPAAPHAQEAGA